MKQRYLGRTRVGRVRVAMVVSLLAIAGCGMNVPFTEDGTAGVMGRSQDDRTPHPDNKVACDRCGGLWGVHGIASVESCICRTKDGGQSCTSGSDCQGACIVADDAAFEVVEQGDPPLGVFVGRCADY